MNPQALASSMVRLFAVAALSVTSVVSAQEQSHYATPDEAVDALIAAAASDEPGAMRAVLGPDVEGLRSGDAVADAQERDDFVAAALEAANIEQSSDDEAVLAIGNDDWPFPIPLVRDDQGWRFDTAAGTEELLDRRVGRNELQAIAVLRALVEAQHEYAAEDRNGDGVAEYASMLMSSDGARDGLYWEAGDDEAESPVGRLVAEAVAAGYSPGESAGPSPYYGYLYRLLKSQGKSAPGGPKDYVRDGRLTGGFAFLAYPAEYGQSGIMTMIVNDSGFMFEQDLGEETATQAAAITEYDPDPSWDPVR